MGTPYFINLVQIDQEHYIAACRHGLVHVTWARSTVRFSRDEFRRLAGLLKQATETRPPTVLWDGDLRVTSRPDEDCELQMGSLILLLSSKEFGEFARAAQDALVRLDQFLAAGVWNKEPEEGRPGLLDQLRRTLFSKN